MKRNNIMFLSFFLSLGAVAGYGQGVRTWVATTGNDLGPCSRTEPCRTFAAAIAAVNTGGEVVVLDSGGYGPVTIDKAVSVIAPGGIHAAIAPTTGIAVTVDAGSAAVVIRNLFLNSQGATQGIRVIAASSVSLQDCTFQNFLLGVVLRNVGTSFIRDSVFRNWTNTAVHIGTAGEGFCQALVERSAFETGGDGVAAVDSSRVIVKDSSFMGATHAAVHLQPAADKTAEVDIESCLIVRNNAGINVFPTAPTIVAIVRVAQTRISGNTIGIVTAPPGEIVSLGNNRLAANGSTQVFTSTVPQQ